MVVDSATPAVTAGVVRIVPGEVRVLAQRRAVDARAHGELLAPQIAECLRAAGASAPEIGAVVAGLGPGPFTGLRVGLVTAAAIGQALGVPAYGVCSLDGIGAAPALADGGPVLVATDARRREIYWAVYHGGTRLGEPAVDRPADVAARLAGLGVARAAGDGALRYADVLGVPVPAEPRFPDLAALAGLAADRVLAAAPDEVLTPLYLRRPDATLPRARKAVLT